ncbi:MAG: redoxin domain-containing protein [Armatimonas sp.]
MRRSLWLYAVPAALPLAICATFLPKPTPTQAATPKKAEPVVAAITITDLSGKSYETGSAKATLLFFLSNECPIAQRYVPKVRELAQSYQSKGVTTFVVNASGADSTASFKKWATERKLTMPLVKDTDGKLAGQVGATLTPEAVVLDPTGAVRYVGLVDNAPEALEAVLTGQPVKKPRVLAKGCFIFIEKASPATATAKVTYSKDIAPILNKNCVVCHRKGDVAPFSLANYEEVKPWASMIQSYTQKRLMPPWKATPGHGDFLDSRWVTDEEISKITAWASSGAPEGNKKDLPAPPKLHPAGTWALGTPDTVLKAPKPFQLEAEGKDVYRDFTLPIDFNEDRYISAIDFKPDNPAIVHHMIAYVDVDGSTVARREGKDGQPGWEVSGGGSGVQKDDWAEGWAPGMNPRRQPDGVAIKIPKGAKLVLQIHYHKSGKPETDNSAIGLYWAKGPVTSVRKVMPIGNPFILLQPNKDGQEVRANMTVPVNVTLREILPHMHMLGKTMKVWATLPDGTEKKLVYIQNWDFNWQMAYRYTEPIKLPRGTKLSLVATYDNTTKNPNQPSNPPKLVTFGEQTTDEMCFAFLAFSVDH